MEAADLAPTALTATRIRLTHDYPMEINACLDALSEEQLWWRAHEEANAVANLVLHLAGSNHFYLEHVIGGKPLARDRDGEFTARGSHSRAELRAVWNASVEATRAALEAFDISRLNETTMAMGRPVTLERILLHVSHHNAIHMGQIICTTKMLVGAAPLGELWKRTQAP
jgi:uncharacterized damage-inducible protein DinB